MSTVCFLKMAVHYEGSDSTAEYLIMTINKQRGKLALVVIYPPKSVGYKKPLQLYKNITAIYFLIMSNK